MTFHFLERHIALPMSHAATKPRRSKLFLAFGGLFFLVAVFIFAPLAIHAVYRLSTPDSVIQSRRFEYSRLADTELKLTGAAKTSSAKTRYSLYLWFHARGLPIDEGHDADVLWQRWSDLINYWRDGDGSRFYPTSSNDA
jgi:hypothetical protein